MPAPVAPLFGYCLGVLFAWIARDELGRAQGAGWIASRSTAAMGLFAFMVFGPICAYFVAFEADWAFAYRVDTRHMPSALELALVLVDIASVPVGFALAVPRARARRLSAILRLGLPILVIACGAVLGNAGRLTVHATYAQFHGDFGTRPVAGSPLGYALLWLDSLLAFGVVWTIHKLRALGSSGRGLAPATERPGEAT